MNTKLSFHEKKLKKNPRGANIWVAHFFFEMSRMTNSFSKFVTPTWKADLLVCSSCNRSSHMNHTSPRGNLFRSSEMTTTRWLQSIVLREKVNIIVIAIIFLTTHQANWWKKELIHHHLPKNLNNFQPRFQWTNCSHFLQGGYLNCLFPIDCNRTNQCFTTTGICLSPLLLWIITGSNNKDFYLYDLISYFSFEAAIEMKYTNRFTNINLHMRKTSQHHHFTSNASSISIFFFCCVDDENPLKKEVFTITKSCA